MVKDELSDDTKFKTRKSGFKYSEIARMIAAQEVVEDKRLRKGSAWERG